MTLAPLKMSGKTVVLTGVTRGLGRALALQLADLGHTVLGCGRSPSAVAELRREIRTGHRREPGSELWDDDTGEWPAGRLHDITVVDVADPRAVEAWAARLLAVHPAPDLVINNAGMINASAPLWEVPTAEFAAVLDAAVKGTFYVCRAFLPGMIAHGAGVVVNVSSSWGRTAAPEIAPYCAAKWAIEGLTRALAQELPAGLAAVAVNPGTVHTALLESCYGRAAQTYPGPERWALRAAPFLLALGSQDNGKSLTVPGF